MKKKTIIQNIRLPNGTGKTNTELSLLTSRSSAKGTTTSAEGGIIYVTTRKEIETLDLSRIFGTFGPMVHTKKLRKMRGKVLFTIHGYDDDPAELFEIPEVREFYSVADRFWGGWLYFANLRSECFNSLAFCLLKTFIASKQAAGHYHEVCVERDVLLTFFEQRIEPAAFFCEMAGLSTKTGLKQLHAAAKYLGLNA